MQSLLFDARPELPRVDGLQYVPEYVTARDERELLAGIDGSEWRRDYKRRTQHYGLSYDDAALRGALRWLRDIPRWLGALSERLVQDRVLPRAPENVVVNEYLPGQGIARHVDRAPFGASVALVSLASPITLDLSDPDDGVDHAIDLAPRSLLVLAGDARARWMHGIAPRKSDPTPFGKRLRSRRVSITFRTAKDA